MKMPEDFDDHSNLTPTVVMAILAVTFFVALILVLVLLFNKSGRNNQTGQEQTQPGSTEDITSSGSQYPDTEEIISSAGSAHPDDFDFWEMYPESTEEPEPTEEPEATVENDPSTEAYPDKVCQRRGGVGADQSLSAQA